MPTTTDNTTKASPSKGKTGGATKVPESVFGQNLDYRDLKPQWDKFLGRNRSTFESDLLRIASRQIKLDAIAEMALDKVRDSFSADEDTLRRLITRKGWATELMNVNKRLNRLRLSDNKRLVLSEVYPALLEQALGCEDVDEAITDEIGFANDIVVLLEKEGGPLEMFAREIVNRVGEKRRINFTEDNILRDLVANQVRAGL